MIQGINHFTLAVMDVEKSFDFYVNVLKFRPVAKWKDGAYLTVGNVWVALNYDKNVKDSIRADYSHIAFTCDQKDFLTLKNKRVFV